jgi:HD-GYP domain-containing protein (c-di-GMP phosphodiesterase class II)
MIPSPFSETDQQFQALIQAFPDSLLIVKSDGSLVSYKDSREPPFPLPIAEYVGQKFLHILPSDAAIKFEDALHAAFEQARVISFDFFLPVKLQFRWYEARLTPLSHILMAVLLRDITPRKEVEMALRRQADRLAALRTIELTTTSSLDLHMTLTLLINQVRTQTNMDAASILLLDSSSQALKYAAGCGFHTNDFEHTSLKLGDGYAGRAALTRQTIRIVNLSKRQTDFLRSPTFSQEGFTDYFGLPLVVKGRVLGVLELFHRSPLSPNVEWFEFLNMLVTQVSFAVESALMFDKYERTHNGLTQAYDATIEGWSRALELRDRETQGHTRRVTAMTVQLAVALGLTEHQIVHIRRGAILHDIGKMAIPDSILFKTGPLDPQEWEIMRRHTNIAVSLLEPIQYLAPALEIPQYHHEKWDGSGYPFGLKGEQIPLAARLFAVVDVYDALTSDRPYRSAWTREQTLAYLRAEAGRHFDPKVVDIFLKMLEG